MVKLALIDITFKGCESSSINQELSQDNLLREVDGFDQKTE
jgi:hypothetical protein